MNKLILNERKKRKNSVVLSIYEDWNFNRGIYLFTTDIKEIHVAKFYYPAL